MAEIASNIRTLQDPNKGKNRIAGVLEMRELRALAGVNNQLANNLVATLTTARQKHNVLQQQRAAILRSLESIESAISASLGVIEAFQLQISDIKERNRELLAPCHPIRRCPDEILQEIFETTVLPLYEKERSRTSLVLSQVCRRWRRVALSTSFLWTHVNLGLTKRYDPTHITELFQETKRRVGQKPITVCIDCIQVPEQPWDRYQVECILEACHFNRFDSIDSISLKLPNISHLVNDVTSYCGYSAGPLQRLTVKSGGIGGYSELASILKIFPTTRHVDLEGFELCIVEQSPANFSTLLSLHHCGSSELGLALASLTSLRELTIVGDMTLYSNVTLPNLEELTSSSLETNWSYVTAPKLLKFTDRTPCADTFVFLSRHLSLREITIDIYGEDEVALLATSISSETALRISDHCWSFIDWSITTFKSQIASLTLSLEDKTKGISVSEFESLVHGFGFQSVHQSITQGGHPPLTGFDIIAGKDYLECEPWRNSSSMEGCVTTSIEEDSGFASTYRHQLRW